jgi:hypothetical protein
MVTIFGFLLTILILFFLIVAFWGALKSPREIAGPLFNERGAVALGDLFSDFASSFTDTASDVLKSAGAGLVQGTYDRFTAPFRAAEFRKMLPYIIGGVMLLIVVVYAMARRK